MSLDRTLEGRRVRLVHTTDCWTSLRPGDEGVIKFVDDMGTLHIDWDSGSRLGLVDGADRWDVLP